MLEPQINLAEEVRFELTKGCPSPVFKTGAFNRSATLPENRNFSGKRAFLANRASESSPADRNFGSQISETSDGRLARNYDYALRQSNSSAAEFGRI
jgi:hypothetical protein